MNYLRLVKYLITFLLFTCYSAYSQKGFWLQLTSPYAGTVTTFSFDSSKALIIGTDSAGLFRSTNGGVSWSSINNGLNDLRITGFTVSSYGTYITSTAEPRMYRSTNNGLTWEASTPTILQIGAIASGKDGVVYAGGRWGGFFKSNDDGQLWYNMNYNFVNSFPITDMLFRPDGTIYFCGGNVIGSTKNEISWRFGHGFGSAMAWSMYHEICGVGLYVSTTNYTPLGLVGFQSKTIAIDKYDRFFVGTLDSGVYESQQHGFAWSQINNGLLNKDILHLRLDDSSYLYAITGNGQFYRSITSTLKLLPPFLVAPPQDTLNILTSVTLKWRQSNDAESYGVQVSTDPTFQSDLLINSSNIADTFFSVSGFEQVKKYFWRVFSQNSLGNSVFSIPWTFITGPPPPPPTLAYPPDSSIDIFIPSECGWHPSPTATSYFFSFSLSPGFEISSDIPTEDTIFYLNPEREKIIYWRVKAVNMAGIGEYSAIRQFTSLRYPPSSSPNLLSPPEPSRYVPLDANFEWQALPEVTGYDIQIFDNSFENLIYSDTAITDTFKFVTGLPQRTSCSWHVRARNAGGPGLYSVPSFFRTTPVKPSKPILISPKNDSSGVHLSPPKFIWKPADYVTQYRIQGALDSLFHNIKISAYVNDTSYTPPIYFFLQPETTYYWHVMAINDTFNGDWSDTFHFRTIGLTDVADTDEKFSEEIITFSLQNFPNPFNQSTTIEFDLPRSSYVKLSVVNTLGEEVASLINKELLPGKYRETFNANNLSTGVYFYRLQTSEGSILKKMMFLR